MVTTSEFSAKAKNLSEQLNVKTVNGSAIAEAALENLSDERLSDIVGDENKSEEVDQKENENSTETWPLMASLSDLELEDLSPVETQLAEIYEKNWQKRSEDSHGASLHFQFKETPEHLEAYQFYTGLHSIEFKNAEDEKITSQTALKKSKSASQAAEKYDLEPHRDGRKVVIKPNGDIKKSFRGVAGKKINPEYEARFTNIVVSKIFDSSLNQIRILTETTHGSDTTAESYRLDND